MLLERDLSAFARILENDCVWIERIRAVVAAHPLERGGVFRMRGIRNRGEELGVAMHTAAVLRWTSSRAGYASRVALAPHVVAFPLHVFPGCFAFLLPQLRLLLFDPVQLRNRKNADGIELDQREE